MNCWASNSAPPAMSSNAKATVPTRRTFFGGSAGEFCTGGLVLISSILLYLVSYYTDCISIKTQQSSASLCEGGGCAKRRRRERPSH